MDQHNSLQFLSDPQIETELGKRLKRKRVDLGLNQTELAEKAGLGRRTVSAVENGNGCSLPSFIALLRALGALHELAELLLPPEISPIALTATKVKERKNPYKARRKKPDTPWAWGDEKP